MSSFFLFVLYRYCFRKHLGSEFLRQSLRCHYVYRYTKHLKQFVTNGSDVEQRGFRGRVNQNVQVATLYIIAMDDRAENTWIACMM